MVANPGSITTSNTRELWLPALICLLLLSGEFYALFQGLTPTSERASLGPAQKIGQLVKTTNTVRYKTAGTLAWSTPQEQQELYEEDTIATLPNSEAILTFFDESELVIEPESLVVLEKAPSQAYESTPIIARLIRGSIVRKKSGKTPFLVKLDSKPETKPIVFKDLESHEGRSIFRIIHREHGIEVIVESGKIQMGDQELTPENTLAAPKLKTPKVKIHRTRKSSWLEKLNREFQWIPSAHAKAPNESEPYWVEVDFEWEENTRALAYRIQVSWDADFKDISIDQKIDQAQYTYETEAPKIETNIYFRVAAIDANDHQGPFSSIAEVKIRPEEAHALYVKRKTEGTLRAKKKTDARTYSTTKFKLPEPKGPTKTELKASVSYGAHYQKRTLLQHETSGFVPSKLTGSFSIYRSHSLSFEAWGDVFLEKASFQQTTLHETQFNTFLFHINTSALIPVFSQWTFASGLYLTNTLGNLLLSSGQLSSSPKALLGFNFGLQREKSMTSRFFPKINLSPLFLGTLGLDMNLSSRFSLAPFFKETTLLNWRGFFTGFELYGRWTNLETAYGGGLEFGYQL